MTTNQMMTTPWGNQTTQSFFTRMGKEEAGHKTMLPPFYNESLIPTGNQSTFLAFHNESSMEMENQDTPATQIYTLKGLNDAVAENYYGAVIFLAVLMVPGIIGNMHALHIYIFKKPKNNTRVYICFLAIIDLICCVVLFPFSIIRCMLPYMFYSNFACKFFLWLYPFIIMASAISLIVIAIERYRKICTPFKTQVTIKYAKLSCLMVAIVSGILSSPSFYIFGSTKIQTGHPEFIGYECFIRAELRETYHPIIYVGGVLIMSISSSCVMIALYGRIGIRLWRQHVKMRENQRIKLQARKPDGLWQQEVTSQQASSNIYTKEETVVTSVTATLLSQHNTGSEHPIADKGMPELKQHEYPDDRNAIRSGDKITANVNRDKGELKKSNPNGTGTLSKNETIRDRILENGKLNESNSGDKQNSQTDCIKQKPKQNVEQANKKSRRNISKKDDKYEQTKKTTYMFFMITLCYIVSYIPFPILRMYEVVHTDWRQSLSLEARNVYHLVSCFLFMNNVINSFIYMLCDRHYRQELRGFYARLLSKCK